MTTPGNAPSAPPTDPPAADERLAQIHGLVAAGGPQIDLQPIHDLHDLRVVVVQARPRFPGDADRGRWFTDARALDVELELELAAVAAALSGVKQALPALPEDVGLWVDVSPATALAPQLAELLATSAVPVTVSVSERAVGADSAALRAAATELRRTGVRFAVSGVGGEYAALRHVVQVEPDVVRLDRTLTRGIHRDIARTELTRAVVRVAEHLGASLVADGIEDLADVDALVRLGITGGQGPGLPDAAPPPAPRIRTGTAPPPPARAGVARDLATLARPVLELVLSITGLQTAYLTVLDPRQEWLEHRFVCNTGTLQVPEGLTIPWIDSLCRRCRDAGLLWTPDIHRDLPPIPLGRDIPIRTFVSVPVVLGDGRTAGTLCAMDPAEHHLDGDMLAELAFFTRLLADRHPDELGGDPTAPVVHSHHLTADPATAPRPATPD